MKYNFTESIIELIKQKEAELNNKVNVFDEETLKRIKESLEIINECHYQEFDGLRVDGKSIQMDEDTVYIPLINRHQDIFNMKITKNGTLLLLGENDYLLKINDKFDPEKSNLYATSFSVGNDYVEVMEELNQNLVFELYTNVINSNVKTSIIHLIPDYRIVIKHAYDGSHYYTSTPFSKTKHMIGGKSLSLDEKRELTKLFIEYCYSQMEKLEIKPRSK